MEEEEEEEETMDPDTTDYMTKCLKLLVENDTSDFGIYNILRHEVEDESHYWIVTGWADVDEYIVNEVCDTICYRPGWGWNQDIGDKHGFTVDCKDHYANHEWSLVWPK